MRPSSRLRVASNALLESLCPVVIVGLALDSLTRVSWSTYAGRDVQIYAAVARLWEDGYLPYRDVYDFKPPLIYVVMRLGFAVWGYHPESLRYLLMLLTGLGALSLYLGLRRAGHAVAAPIAAMSLLTLIVPDTWVLAFQNTEILVAGVTAVAIGCAAAHERGGRWWWAVATGAATALAALSKQPAVLFAVPLLVHLWLQGIHDRWPARTLHAARCSALFCVGFAAIIGGTAAYFAWHDALTALIEAVLINGRYYAQLDASSFLTPHGWIYLARRPVSRLLAAWMIGTHADSQLGHIFTQWRFIAPLYLLLPATLLRPSRLTVTAWLWVTTAYFAVVAGPGRFDHYTILAYPALAFVAGAVGEAVVGWLRAPREQDRTARVAVGLVIAAVLFGPRWQVSYLPRRHLDLRHDVVDGGLIFGERIRTVAKAGDTLWVEREPFTTYLYAGAAPATRFIYWDAPHPDAFREHQEGLRRLPSFVVFTVQTYERLRDPEAAARDPRYALAADVLRDYEEIFAHPDGVVLHRVDDPCSSVVVRPPFC